MRALAKKAARTILIPIRGSIDTTVGITATAALVIRGAQYLDGAGVIHLPVLHDPIGHAMASLPIDHAASAAEALGGLGDWGVADGLFDLFGLFSIGKVGYNLWKRGDLDAKTGDLWQRVYELQGECARMRCAHERAESIRRELHDSSYEVFKLTLISRELRRKKRQKTERRSKMEAHLVESARALWTNLATSVSGHRT